MGMWFLLYPWNWVLWTYPAGKYINTRQKYMGAYSAQYQKNKKKQNKTKLYAWMCICQGGRHIMSIKKRPPLYVKNCWDFSFVILGASPAWIGPLNPKFNLFILERPVQPVCTGPSKIYTLHLGFPALFSLTFLLLLQISFLYLFSFPLLLSFSFFSPQFFWLDNSEITLFEIQIQEKIIGIFNFQNFKIINQIKKAFAILKIKVNDKSL